MTDERTPGPAGDVAGDGDADAGAFIGHEPERASETIPGGVRDDDERVAAHSTQSTGAGRPDERGQPAVPQSGHREGATVSDAELRRAGDETG